MNTFIDKVQPVCLFPGGHYYDLGINENVGHIIDIEVHQLFFVQFFKNVIFSQLSHKFFYVFLFIKL